MQAQQPTVMSSVKHAKDDECYCASCYTRRRPGDSRQVYDVDGSDADFWNEVGLRGMYVGPMSRIDILTFFSSGMVSAVALRLYAMHAYIYIYIYVSVGQVSWYTICMLSGKRRWMRYDGMSYDERFDILGGKYWDSVERLLA